MSEGIRKWLFSTRHWLWLALLFLASGSIRGASLYLKSAMDASAWPTNYPGIPTPGAEDRLVRVRADLEDGFDSAMRAFAVPRTRVYLGPGTFETRGVWNGGFGQTNYPGFRLPSHSELHGTRFQENLSTLKLMAIDTNNGVANENRVICPQITAPLAEMQVTDLNVDCNAPYLFARYGKPLNLSGVTVTGENSLLRNVNVRNASQIDTNGIMTVETFVLWISAHWGTVTNALIDHCTVSNFYNPFGYGKCSAIALTKDEVDPGYISGAIQNCTVQLNGFGGEFSFNSLRTRSLVLSNNLSLNAAAGFNNDTPFNTNLTFINNTFILPASTNGGYGLLLHGGSYWTRISSNSFTIRSPGQSAIWMSGEYTNTWLGEPRHVMGVHYALIDHNRVTRTPFAGISYGFCLNAGGGATPPDHIQMEANWADPSLVNLFPAAAGFASRNLLTLVNTNGLPLKQPNPGWMYPSFRTAFGEVGQSCLVLVDSNRDTRIWPFRGPIPGKPLTPNPTNTGTWRIVGVADFNRDGNTDLLVREDGSGELSCWFMDGTSRAGESRLAVRPTGTFDVVGVADFNGDNKPDILLENDQADLELWLMDGLARTRSVALRPNNPGDPHWRVVGTGDFNDDGRTDVLWQYLNPGSTSDSMLGVWLMRGLTRTKAVLLDPHYPESKQMRVVATGHFNPKSAAHNTDLVMQLKSLESDWGGPLSIYFMSNITRVGTVPISGNPGPFNVVGPR